jgi:hypothetical protein
MNTVDDIFTTLGGTGAVAKIIGVKHSAASEMRRRGSIPVRYWPALMQGARELAVSIDSDTLVTIHQPLPLTAERFDALNLGRSGEAA